MTTTERASDKKGALQTRLDQIVQGYRTWLARPPYHVLLQEHRNRTAELGEAIGKIERLTAHVNTETEARVAETQARGMLLDFLQEVMTFVHSAPILVRNGKPWQVKRIELVQRAKAQNWYREPGEQEAEQVTE